MRLLDREKKRCPHVSNCRTCNAASLFIMIPEEKEERFEDCLVEVEPLKEEDIVPFTESQLHALYHNVELEKNAEFVEHWLETQVEF